MVTDLMISKLKMKWMAMMISSIIMALSINGKLIEWVPVLLKCSLKTLKLHQKNIRSITRNIIKNIIENKDVDTVMKLPTVMYLMIKNLKMKMIPEIRLLITMDLLINGKVFIRDIRNIISILQDIIVLHLCKRKL
jgi:hypothetical protein